MSRKHKRMSWTPAVGMVIENFNPGGKKEPNGLAEIIAVIDNETIRIRHQQSGRTTHLMLGTALCNWRPFVPSTQQLALKTTEVRQLSENDVRRIVREELRTLFAPKDGAS